VGGDPTTNARTTGLLIPSGAPTRRGAKPKTIVRWRCGRARGEGIVAEANPVRKCLEWGAKMPRASRRAIVLGEAPTSRSGCALDARVARTQIARWTTAAAQHA